jgi:tetrahydromethanopterin S-methyltransferase subunit C
LTRETIKEFCQNKKLYSTIFKISQVVADPFITLAFIFSPFGIKHQNGMNLGPLTPLPHQNLQLRANRQ